MISLKRILFITDEYYSESDDDDDISPKHSIPSSPESVHEKKTSPSTPELATLRKKQSQGKIRCLCLHCLLVMK